MVILARNELLMALNDESAQAEIKSNQVKVDRILSQEKVSNNRILKERIKRDQKEKGENRAFG